MTSKTHVNLVQQQSLPSSWDCHLTFFLRSLSLLWTFLFFVLLPGMLFNSSLGTITAREHCFKISRQGLFNWKSLAHTPGLRLCVGCKAQSEQESRRVGRLEPSPFFPAPKWKFLVLHLIDYFLYTLFPYEVTVTLFDHCCVLESQTVR